MLKKLLFFLLLAASTLAGAPQALAAPGDTTRVTVFNKRALTYYGNYDTTAVFPAAGRYRKILMHYVLGRYACPPGTQYCGSWDYTTRVLLLPDSLELGRVITPYATDWLSRGITHDYVLDVTDYATRLKGAQAMRFLYDGYSFGFTLTLYMEYIEGVPPRDALDVQRVYNGTFAYGKTTDPIENRLSAKNVKGFTGSGQVLLKSFITGHGSDTNTGCAEFCPKSYSLKVNGTTTTSGLLWRDNCGANQVYPQTGTWVYNRSNWCPGNQVDPLYHDVTPTLGLSSGTIDFDMQAYTAPSQANASAVWIWQTQFISYSAPNYTTDAALDEIIAPTNNRNYTRENPICDAPRVKLRNTGSATLTSATILYRVGSSPWRTYQWAGSLPFMAQTEVKLPPVPADFAGQPVFKVYVTAPNNAADQNHYNDTLRARFNAVAVLPSAMKIVMATNSDWQGVSENSWTIADQTGAVVASRTGAATNSVYTDNVTLAPGCYTFTVADTGCDGFAWWANPNAGNGTLRFLNPTTNAVITTVSGDFGCEYKLRFNVAQVLSTTPAQALAVLDVFPNPSKDGQFTLDLNLPTRQDVQLTVRTVTGQLVHSAALAQVQATTKALDLHRLAPGVYLLECKGSAGTSLVRRLLIP
jgi:hypothetical protein